MLKNILGGCLAFGILGGILLNLIPLDAYVPDVERKLSERLHMPVSVGHMQASMFPFPHVELRNVLLGGGNAGIAAQAIEASLKLARLLTGNVAFDVEVRDGAAHLGQVRRLVAALSESSSAQQGGALGEVRLSRMIVMDRNIAAGPLDGKLEFDQSGVLRHIRFSLDENKLVADLVSMSDRRFALQLRATDWMMPGKVALPMEDIRLDGVVDGRELVVQRFSATAGKLHLQGSGRLEYADGWSVHARLGRIEMPLETLMVFSGNPAGLSGMLSGNGELTARAVNFKDLAREISFVGALRASGVRARVAESFRQPLTIASIDAQVNFRPAQIELRGIAARLYGGSCSGLIHIDRRKHKLESQFSLQGMNMSRLVEALTNEVLFSGGLEGEVSLAMSLDRVDRFPDNLDLIGKYRLHDGMIGKVDLLKAVRAGGRQGNYAGETRYDALSGVVAINAGGYHFRDIKLSSGALNAEGHIHISREMRLKGMLDVDVKGTAGLIGIPLSISGTLDHPEIGPSSGALAGAAVGTAVLGPGLGTAVGARFGGFLNKLFGNHNENQENKTRTDPVPVKRIVNRAVGAD